ncbi:L,D-transpeptidase [Microbacterium hominis]|uniref:L,D-transpeptidase n=2 Tax=Microbacterium hominis TaxID=162426 RepID=A0A7D4QEW8_9MICO|nr:L,D-transpeptidase [Microbacterium hominis]
MAVALVVASLFLIAPGTSIAGVPVGGMTVGGATDAVQQRLAQTTIVLTGAGDDVTVTGADLGASVDASALADDAFAAHPMWNPTTWNGEPSPATVTIDHVAATEALVAAVPDLYVEPVDATLAYDADAARYVTTPSTAGSGIDLAVIEEALQSAFDSGKTSIDLEPAQVPIEAVTTSAIADETAARLNGILESAGFYVGDDRAVAVEPAVAASWLTVTRNTDGTYAISADAGAIQSVVDTLPAAIDRAAVDATVITNSSGGVLRTVTEGVTGRTLGATDGIADDYAAQLAGGEGAFALPVTEQEFTTTALERTIEVDLGAQRAYLYENDEMVANIIVSSGLSGSPTPQGRFTVNGYSRIQSMGCFDGAPYCVEDVPYVTWFAPDIGFHGASNLRSSLGFPQSHGCVNMWDNDAKFVYDWTVPGTEVWVHA